MTFRYKSGEEIKQGDRVHYNSEAGEVEFVAASLGSDVALNWYVEEYGGGVMLRLPSMGSLFITDPQDTTELVLVSRR